MRYTSVFFPFPHDPSIPMVRWRSTDSKLEKKVGADAKHGEGRGRAQGEEPRALPRPKRVESEVEVEFVRVQRARVDAARWLVRSFVRSFVVVSLTTT